MSKILWFIAKCSMKLAFWYDEQKRKREDKMFSDEVNEMCSDTKMTVTLHFKAHAGNAEWKRIDDE